MTHRTDIDGLRALAIIPVVLYHMGVPAFSGGFVGVDIFFVISGFLITSLIARDLGQPDRRFSLTNFYERRIRRIFPALFTVLAVTTVLAVIVLLPRDLSAYAKSLVATAAFASNIHFFRQAGYFDTEAYTKPLLHTWSLAVEEQFYLFFPLLMLVLFRVLKRGARVGIVLAGLALASFAWSVWTVHTRPDAAFYLAPARAWELLLGSVLALGVVPAFRTARSAHAAGILGVALLGLAVVAFSHSTPFPGVAALVPCLGAALVIHSGGATPIHRVLSSAPLVFIGLISYSLYLWHWSLLSLARHWSLDPLTMPQTVAVVGVALLASVSSWRFIEQPLRKPAPRGSLGARSKRRKRVFGLAAAASSIALLIGLIGASADGLPGRLGPDVIALDAAQQDFNDQRPKCHASDRAVVPYRDTCRFGATDSAPRYAVWGDSHAAELAVALGELAADAGESVRMITYSACPPGSVRGGARGGTGGCAEHDRATLKAISEDTTVFLVFLVARYSQARQDQGDVYFVELGRVARALADAGKEVVLVYPSPEYQFSVPIQLARAAYRGANLEMIGLAREAFEAQRSPFVRALDAIRTDRRIGMVDPSRRLCDESRCRTFAEGRALYFDDDHLSLSGARYVGSAFVPFFRSIDDAADLPERLAYGTRTAW